MNNIKSGLDYIYDVSCPVCGRVPSYTVLGDKIQYEICCHPELEDLIGKREEYLCERRQEAGQLNKLPKPKCVICVRKEDPK